MDYLLNKFPLDVEEDNLWIDARVLPSMSLVIELNSLRVGESLERDGETFAFRSAVFEFERINRIDSNASFEFIRNL